jgi:hypothetical protein
VIRRVYTNRLPIEEYEPESPMEVTLELDGTKLCIEQRHSPSEYPEVEEVEDGEDDEDDEDDDGDDDDGEDDDDDGEDDDDDDGDTAPPEPRETVHPTADDARRDFDAEVARLLPRAGVDPPPGEDAELLWVGPGWPAGHGGWIRADECAVETTESDAAAPQLGSTDDDDDVLADWQLGHADPHVRARGELSNLQRVRDPASRARAKELVAAHADAWLSGLLPIATIGFRRGFVDTVRLAPSTAADAHTFDGAAMTDRRELAAFLALPIVSRLRRLVLGPVGPIAISGNPYIDNQPLLDALGDSAPARLCDVELLDGNLETLAPLWRLAVERVTTRCFTYRLGTIASGSLRELRVLQGYGHSDLPFLAQADCPRLETLEVRTRINDGFQGEIVRFLGAGFPALRHLTFAPTTPAHDTLAFVERSPLLSRLQTLTLGGAAFTAEAVTALVAAAPRFAHLEQLVIEGGDALAAEPAAALRRALPRIALAAAVRMTD